MIARTYPDPAEYLSRVQPMLEASEAKNNLILGVVLRLKEHPEWSDSPAHLALVENKTGQPLLAAAITPPHSLLLAALSPLPEPLLGETISVLIETLVAGRWPVPGSLAESTLAEDFARAWERATGRKARLKMRQRIYSLRAVVPPPQPPPGELRLATSAEIDLASRWYYAFSIEAMGQGNLVEARKQVARLIPSGNLYFWENQRPVSMAVGSRPTPHGHTVGAVYTPPQQRGKGYASACVAALSQRLLDNGKQFCTLFTDLSNPTSNSIYQKIGYRPVCDFAEYLFTD